MNRAHRWLCSSAVWRRALEHSILPWALDGAELEDGVLELGPGPGLTTDLLQTRAPHLTALELDPRMADALRRRLGQTNVRVVQGDAADLPFGDDAFSAVVSLTMLHHVPSVRLQDRLLAEAYRVLQPGGVFVGTDNTWNLAFRLLHLGDTLVPVDPGTLPERLAAVGFTGVSVDRAAGRFRFQARKARGGRG